MKNKFILDAACGARLFWFNKKHPNVVYCDKRVVPHQKYYKSRFIEINPDVVCDFTKLPFPDNFFKLVVFDPPHLRNVGENSWLYIKYGRLESNWQKMIRDGFNECMRVLENYGVLIFKWSEYQIPLSKILKVVDQEPLFGNKHPRQSGTHWLCFMKTQHHKH